MITNAKVNQPIPCYVQLWNKFDHLEMYNSFMASSFPLVFFSSLSSLHNVLMFPYGDGQFYEDIAIHLGLEWDLLCLRMPFLAGKLTLKMRA